MDSVRLRQIEDIYHAACEVDEAGRESFLDYACGSDGELRREVESLLRYDETPSVFIDNPPESFAAEMLADRKEEVSYANKSIGHYKVIRLIGAGGMGEVYLAEDTKLDRKVALKILPSEFARDTNRMSRFIREAKSASALNHPNIITIYEINEFDGTHFIATEFIDGKTLNDYTKDNSLNRGALIDIAIQIASALDEAHQAGLVHRDIKPENVMIRKNGVVKVLDFGLAKASSGVLPTSDSSEDATVVQFQTQPGLIIGTPNYMSPEQARGKHLDHQTDIFSFGVVLYEMFSGIQPFAGESVSDIIAALLTKEAPPFSDVPAEIDNIIFRALKKAKSDRYQTASDLLNDLKHAQKRLDSGFNIHARTETVSDQAATQIFAKQPTAEESSSSRSSQIGRTLAVDDETESLNTDVGKDATDDKPRANTTVSSLSNTAFFAHRSLAFASILLLVLATGGFFAYRYFTAVRDIRSIAVMPFANETGSSNNEYVSDGLSDSLINKLSQLPHLKIISRTSTFRYKGKDLDVGEVARSLGVEAIITGQITQQGDTLQINVEMIRASDNTRIWGEGYSRKVSDDLNVPTAIAEAVAERLEIKLSPDQERRMVQQITSNAKAYQLHMNGVFFRRKNGVENIRKAIEYQDQAVKLDPNFTRAYVEQSINYAILVDIRAMSPAEGLPKARAAAELALTLDDRLADAHYNIARIRKYEFQWVQAETAFKRAIELNPNLAAAHTIYAEFLSQLGRFDEALREIRMAQELDPLRTGLVGNEGSIYYFARQYDEAIVKKQIHITAAPDNPFAHLGLGNAYTGRGQYAEAILAYQASVKAEETPSGLIYLGRAYALTGRPDEAVAILAKLKASEKYVSPAELAMLYIALAERDQAFASLEKAYNERDVQLTSLNVDPAYDPIRSEPRFQQILKRLNLP